MVEKVVGINQKKKKMDKDLKLCIDCLNHQIDDVGTVVCRAPQNIYRTEASINLVDGKTIGAVTKYRYNYADTHRKDGWFNCRTGNTCGQEGRWFELVI